MMWDWTIADRITFRIVSWQPMSKNLNQPNTISLFPLLLHRWAGLAILVYPHAPTSGLPDSHFVATSLSPGRCLSLVNFYIFYYIWKKVSHDHLDCGFSLSRNYKKKPTNLSFSRREFFFCLYLSYFVTVRKS